MIEAKLACMASGMGFDAWRRRPAYRAHCMTYRIATLLCDESPTLTQGLRAEGMDTFRCLRAHRSAAANALRQRVARYIVALRRDAAQTN